MQWFRDWIRSYPLSPKSVSSTLSQIIAEAASSTNPAIVSTSEHKRTSGSSPHEYASTAVMSSTNSPRANSSSRAVGEVSPSAAHTRWAALPRPP